MAKFLVEFEIEDAELTQAIKFLGSTDAGVQAIKDEYLSGVIRMDLRRITDDQKRYYHTNGLTAMLVSVQDEITKS
jgi:hypothetical protein